MKRRRNGIAPWIATANSGQKPRAGVAAMAGVLVMAGMMTGCADESPFSNTSTETGSIELTLTTDYDFSTAKPVFTRAEGEETRATAALGDYTTNVPTADQFKIKLENTSGYLKEWGSLTAFNSSEEITKLPTGLYTITAYYGTEGAQGEDCPYFEAKSSFTVLPNRPSEVSLKAELKNSMVYIDYTDDFKEYMDSYTTTLSTTGNTQDAISMNAAKAVFVDAGNVSITVDFTTKETQQSTQIEVGAFPAIAKTLHKMTFDIDHKNNGFATLTLTFDESIPDEISVSIDLTQELFATDGPSISYTGSGTGVENGSTIDMTGNPDKVELSVLVPGGLNEAKLTVNGTGNYTREIDLRTTDPSILAGEGIISTGFYGTNIEATNTLALLDITAYAKSLPTGEYETKLDIKDKSNRSASYVLKLNTETIALSQAKDNSNKPLTEKIEYGASNSQLILDYNGSDYQELTFKASDADGNMTATTASYLKSESITRASEMRRCYYNVALPHSKQSEVKFIAYNKAGEELATFSVPVAVPEYEVLTDAYSRYAYVKIAPKGGADLTTIMSNIEFNSTDVSNVSNISKDNTSGIITITGLTPGESYNIGTSITKGDDNWNTKIAFNAEVEQQVPNGDFTATTETINKQKIEVGGQYTHSINYSAWANIVINEADDWASINAKTCWFDCPGAKNTWFQVPSTYAKNGQVVLRNVAYDHNGVKPKSMPTGLGKNYWYNTNVPTFTNFAAGELFLGSYSFDGSEHRKDGIDFSSRPSSVEFYYTYAPTGNDNAYVEIKVLNSAEAIISSSTSKLPAQAEKIDNEKAKFHINLPAYPFGEKAAKLLICFRSSTELSPKEFVHIPQGDELDEGFGTWYFGETINLGDNNYHALATGSELTLDNVKLIYESAPTPSSAPKNTNRKRR